MTTCADTPLPLAETTAGPAVVDEIVTLALPEAPIEAEVALSVPRVAENVTVCPDCGTPAAVHTTVRVAGVPMLTSALVAGAVKAKLCVLMTTDCVAIRPRAVAVIVSVPPLTAVSVKV